MKAKNDLSVSVVVLDKKSNVGKFFDADEVVTVSFQEQTGIPTLTRYNSSIPYIVKTISFNSNRGYGTIELEIAEGLLKISKENFDKIYAMVPQCIHCAKRNNEILGENQIVWDAYNVSRMGTKKPKIEFPLNDFAGDVVKMFAKKNGLNEMQGFNYPFGDYDAPLVLKRPLDTDPVGIDIYEHRRECYPIN